MNRQRSRPRLQISHGPKKKVEYEQPPDLGNLSPDLQPCSPPTFFTQEDGISQNPFYQIGKYIVRQTNPSNECCTAVDRINGTEFTCKVLPLGVYREKLAPYFATDGHENIVNICEIILGETSAYVFFERGFGDLHSYVREKKKLKQAEARNLARQVVAAVNHCHENGVILRDLKLRKFVFKDAERTVLALDGLDDAIVLDDETASDTLTDKHGCPAYVSPEILSTRHGYSGKCADLWSLGVMIYTMLVGRYPFHDREPIALFSKIRRGTYKIPDSVPARAKCLVRNLLRREPSERLSAAEALDHPWFTRPIMVEPPNRPVIVQKGIDQTVPDYDYPMEDVSLDASLPN
ncbi:tribbles homolog 2-like [Biomphalaria glabrata]|uniref:Tribbles homolog 2-like n=1 Tax=Biomphalaria glabrata TaxID=6526 RepID=A0A9W2ZA49_BIOGL|nr:tribbles homolog 2-like [Biomphalaria glabrata]